MSILAFTSTMTGRVVPFGWHSIEQRADGRAWQCADGLRVIESVGVELDGKEWHHVSLSRSMQLPSWEEVQRVKDIFMGKDVTALQVLPDAAHYVNQHPYCLHLWRCLDGDVTPDFTQGHGSI